jgi:hypothetical protein
MADVYTRNNNAVLKGLTLTYVQYPLVAAGTTVGIVVTSGAGVWGADKEIIAVNAITTDFWVCAMDFDTAGAAQPYVVELEEAGAVSIFSARVDVTAVTVNLGRFAVPFPKRILANTQITARASGTAAKVIGVSVLVATGL